MVQDKDTILILTKEIIKLEIQLEKYRQYNNKLMMMLIGE